MRSDSEVQLAVTAADSLAPEALTTASNETTAKSWRPLSSPSSRVKVAVSAAVSLVSPSVGWWRRGSQCERQAELAAGAVERPAPAPTLTWNRPEPPLIAGLRPRNTPASASGPTPLPPEDPTGLPRRILA